MAHTTGCHRVRLSYFTNQKRKGISVLLFSQSCSLNGHCPVGVNQRLETNRGLGFSHLKQNLRVLCGKNSCFPGDSNANIEIYTLICLLTESSSIHRLPLKSYLYKGIQYYVTIKKVYQDLGEHRLSSVSTKKIS